jgi:hypothetical protein
VGIGLGVVAELMEEELAEVVGPKSRHDPERTAVRRGHEDGELTLGGRRVPVRRPRARAADGSGEVELSVYRHFAARDLLERVSLSACWPACPVGATRAPTRRWARRSRPSSARSPSRRSPRTFIERTRETLADLMSRRLDDVRLAVLMLDGIDLKERTHVVALGITT